MANKWTRLDAPPPLFTGGERDLVKQVNDEIIERIVGRLSLIAYWFGENILHDLYGEAIQRLFAPVAVKALVEYDGKTEYTKNVGLDKTQGLTIHFHKRAHRRPGFVFVRGRFCLMW